MTCWIPFAHLNADSHSDQDAGFLLMDAIFINSFFQPASHSYFLYVKRNVAPALAMISAVLTFGGSCLNLLYRSAGKAIGVAFFDT